ncbi:MAG: IS200/IS605 family transposase [Tunicatimonas sp.]
MSKYKKLSHVVYKCDYHIVWVPKYRFRVLKGAIKELVEHDIKMLCQWKSCEVEELSVQEDHIHLLVSVPPKVSISKLMGTLKGKIAIKLFKSYPKLREKPYWGNHFWARGYFVSTVGLDEDTIRRYVKYQEKEEKKAENQQQRFNF